MNTHMCDCFTLPCHNVGMPYSCPTPPPGYLAEPYHLPGYCGHIPSMRTTRFGSSFGKLSRDVLEDPCVAQAPIPILAHPCRCCGVDTVNRCDDSVFVPRGPMDTGCHEVYRCCEPLCASYAGHKPGFTTHSLGRTSARATFGTGNYIQKCFYNNTHAVI